ncbi:MAG: 23S rRNA (uracil(1939)-C(5))-methyltransferase RlmD [Lachnospiraceae bacterium]|nr:23S rRNA (uracil(1939)-C(5))-methyltransferase RlmD [Lachnospiraceae bacterium]
MYSKNQELELLIEDLGSSGEGIGKIDGFTIFVKDTVIGDKVKVGLTKVKKNYAFARLIEVIEPSSKRVTPVCSAAKQCGGCQLQFMNYEEQLRFKQNKVLNNINRIGGIEDFEMKPIIGMDEPFHYRNKAQFPVGIDRDGNIVSGFYAGRTHSIINRDTCDLGIKLHGVDVNGQVIEIVKNHMREYNIPAYDESTGKGVVRHVLIRIGLKTDQIMVCVVVNAKNLPYVEKLAENLKKIDGMTSISVNINKEKSNVILGQKVINIYGEGYIEDYIGDVKFRISPLSFFQVNPIQTEKLYGKALEYAGLTGKETVWDLYCGIGSISLFLAQRAKKVIGVEIVAPAIEDARVNAQINNIDNAEFIVGAAEDVVPRYFEEHKNEPECTPDVIVVDPPRKGCDEKLLSTVVEMSPKRIVYVSCDSATLARDLKWLGENGYKLVEATPCDMFPQTVHVETVVLLSKLSEAKHHI